MPDISMCKNEVCPKKLECYRYTAIPSEHQQSYISPGWHDCAYFMSEKDES